jgi:phosphoadenosine phosphosulfate reductase
MEDLKERVPNFIEVNSNQPRSIEERGYPTDVLPVDYSVDGQLYSDEKPLKLRNYMECCKENLWAPAAMAIKHYGFTGVIRGQRADEAHGSPIKSGHVEDGVEYLFPLEDWSHKQVVDFLTEQGVNTFGRLNLGHSSLDCWNCTAYCNQNKARMDYIRAEYPEQHAHVIQVMKQINYAVNQQMAGLRELISEV